MTYEESKDSEWRFTSAVRAFGAGCFWYSTPVPESRHIIFWPRVSTKAIAGTFLPRSLRTRSHRGTSLAPPLALLRSSSPPRSSANAGAARPSPALNEQPTAMLRPMLPWHGLNATMTNHHEPIEPRDLEIQHLYRRSKQNFKPLLRATLPLCRHHHRKQRKRVTTKSRLCRELRAHLLRQWRTKYHHTRKQRRECLHRA